MCRRRHIGILLALLTLTLVGCRPKGILHSREMRDVLIELHKTDAILQVKGFRGADRETKNLYYVQALAKHGVTQAQFDSSLVWYTAHPQLFNKIYPKVLAELAQEEADFLALHPEMDFKQIELAAAAEEAARSFTHTDLDSILWVQQNGLPHSWNEWRRPYSLFDF